MHGTRAAAAAALLALLSLGPAATAQDRPPSDPAAPLAQRIEQALHFGSAWLSKQPFAPGNWSNEIGGPFPANPKPGQDPFVQPTGCTSLALWALLRSGVPADDPVVKKGFQWLRATSGGITKGGGVPVSYRVPNGTYELAALALALEARYLPIGPHEAGPDLPGFLPAAGTKLAANLKLPPEDQAWMHDIGEALMKRRNPARGWRYGFWNGREFQNGLAGDSDLCATGMAIAALLAGERCGINRGDEVYAGILEWVLGLQEAEGPPVERGGATPPATDLARGWGYLGSRGAGPDFVSTGSMTASALGTVHACATILRSRKSRLLTPDLAARAERAWRDGMAWLDHPWEVKRNPGSKEYHLYYLLALERLADAAGTDVLAGHRWFEEGAGVLLDGQSPSGAWTGRDTPQPSDLLNTSFALLFLGRATPALLARQK